MNNRYDMMDEDGTAVENSGGSSIFKTEALNPYVAGLVNGIKKGFAERSRKVYSNDELLERIILAVVASIARAESSVTNAKAINRPIGEPTSLSFYAHDVFKRDYVTTVGDLAVVLGTVNELLSGFCKVTFSRATSEFMIVTAQGSFAGVPSSNDVVYNCHREMLEENLRKLRSWQAR